MVDRVGRIRLTELLGRGGMGEVWRGWDEQLERQVAVKSLVHRHRRDAPDRTRFLQEARLLSKLNHPNICKIYDLVHDDEREYLVLEMIEGRSLREVMGGGLERRAKLRIALQIAAVLVAAHGEGIVHRDLKPDNVMITGDGEVKVLDFGIATSAGGGEAMAEVGDQEWSESHTHPVSTRIGAVLGTPRYMSPEQARGDPVTPASDMYAFGLLLQELFSGRSAHERQQSRVEVLLAVSEGRTVPVAGLGRALTELIRRLKAVNPPQRPSAKETLDRLQWIADTPGRWLRRGLTAVVLAAAIIGAVKYTVDLRRERAAAMAALDRAEGLVTFMLDDLVEELGPLGHLEVLDRLTRRALRHYETAPDQDTPEAMFNRARAYNLAAEVLADRGDVLAAMSATRGAVEIHRDLVAREPARARWRDGLARALLDLVNLLNLAGQAEEARATVAEARTMAEAAVALEPDEDGWRETVAETWYGEGLLVLVSDVKADPELFRRAIEIYDELAARHPDEPRFRYRRAVMLGQGLGQAHAALGEREASLAAVERALATYRELVELDPANTRWQFAYAWEIRRWAEHLEAQGRQREALAAYERSRAISERLLEVEPDNASWRTALALDHFATGLLWLELGDLARARPGIERAVALERQILALEPRSPDAAATLADGLLSLGQLCDREGRRQAAVESWEEARSLLAPFIAQGNRVPWLVDLWVRAHLRLGRGAEVTELVDELVSGGYLDSDEGQPLAELLSAGPDG